MHNKHYVRINYYYRRQLKLTLIFTVVDFDEAQYFQSLYA